MNVTLLGTGSALPSTTRVQSSVLVEARGRTLLVDCGSGALHRLAQVGVDPVEVDGVLLTHHHLDHVADLPSLAKARFLSDHPKLTVAGPRGTGVVLDDLLAIDDLDERIAVETRTITGGQFEFAGFEIDARETRHSKECYAYRFGDRIALGGDTAPFEALVDFVDGVDVLVHECAYPDGVDADGHTTPSRLAQLLADRDIETVYLTHLFPEAERSEEALRRAIRGEFDGDVVVASDRTVVDL